jgi:lipopolysaccharide/colanic/teichoic acid biosynthesis glycosyltransferase
MSASPTCQEIKPSSAYACSPLKRGFDLVFGTVWLIVLSPLLLLISLAIKLDSPGPVFYRGVRIGLFGRHFRIFKFRTMIPEAELVGTTSTGHRDPRITRVGRILRPLKLDELPQLLNVLRGEMSIVGPRPEVEEHTSAYTPEEQVILSVLPGITDYASIEFIDLNRLVGSEDPRRIFIEKYRSEKNRLRVLYVRQQSFGTDLAIILRTFLRLFWRKR